MHDLVADGNSVVLVDHDAQILKEAGWLIEMGPEAGAKGGQVIAEGTIAEIAQNKNSKIGPIFKGRKLRNTQTGSSGKKCLRQGASTLKRAPSIP